MRKTNNKSFLKLLKICLRSTCPVCEKGHLFAPFFSLRSHGPIFFPVEECEVCYFKFNREPGYFAGCVFPLLPIMALFVAACFAILAYFVFKLEIDQVVIATLVGAVLGFIGLFRVAIALFIALDHALNPAQSHH